MASFLDETSFWMKSFETRGRHYPSDLPVTNVGYCPSKCGRLEASFFTCNFSFILSGDGEYRNSEGSWKIVAPCVIMQWPGEVVSYGPAHTFDSDIGKTWEEFYVMYDGSLVEKLKSLGFFDPAKPIWSLNNTAGVHQKIGEIYSLCEQENPHGLADRIDRLCELLVLESLLSESEPERSATDSAIISLFSEVENCFLDPIDFVVLARKYGFSPPTFRRYWKSLVGIPPARYLMERRLQHAGHLLIETDLAIGEIAERILFDDQLYFSRKFKSFFGLPPTEFRRSYRGKRSIS